MIMSATSSSEKSMHLGPQRSCMIKPIIGARDSTVDHHQCERCRRWQAWAKPAERWATTGKTLTRLE